jgi:hypothetical protein
MTSTPIRDQAGDHLITPQNSAAEERHWDRTETVPQIIEIVLNERLLKALPNQPKPKGDPS